MSNSTPEGERTKRPGKASGRARAASPRRATRTKARSVSAAKTLPALPALPKPPPAKRGRDPLLAAICHDLRAPLAALTMGTNFVLQTTQRDDASARSVKILEAMLRSCTQMERLIRNFADLSEIESNSLALRLGYHDARELLDLAAAAHRDAAQGRRVTIDVVQPEQPITMQCDRERLLRAIGHVVENAVKLAPQGSTVTLAVTLRDGSVSFSIVDRGPGLTAQVRKNLYDRHWHAKRANRVGAGFGLAITRGFVAAHEGKLSVESRAGELTTFTLVLPQDGPKAHAELNGSLRRRR